MSQVNDASPDGDRAIVPSASSPQAVSPVPASIPSAGDWIVFHESSYDPVGVIIKQATKVTPSIVKFGGSRPRQCHILSVVAAYPDKETAERIRDQINGVSGEYKRRKYAAQDECSRRITEALDAANRQIERIASQGIAARSDETRSGSAEGKSPVAESDAPNSTARIS